MSSAQAAALAIVDVPQGMILETQLARPVDPSARAGEPVEFVVTHDVRVGPYVVVSAGSHGVGRLVPVPRGASAAAAPRVVYDYVMASDGTRIPVSGSLPYLTTRASRPVVIYAPGDDLPRASALPVSAGADAPLTGPRSGLLP